MARSRTLAVAGALLVVYVVWGSTYAAIAVGIDSDGEGASGLPPLLMGGVRFLLAGALLFAVATRLPDRDAAARPDPLGWPQWRACAVVGSALLVAGNGLVSLSEERIDSGLTAVAIATVPIWTALLGAATRGGERLAARQVVGVVLGFVGVAVLVSGSWSGELDLFGLALALTAALGWAWGSWYSGRVQLPRRPLVMTGMQMLCGGGLMLALALLRGEGGRLDLGAVEAASWWAFGYLVLFGSLGSFTAYVWLLRNARLSLVTTYAYVNPVVAVALGAVLLDEELTARVLVATGVTIAGVALLVVPRREPALPEPTAPERVPA